MTQEIQLDQVSICYPLTWWDAVVERWISKLGILARWWLKRWPVRYRVYVVKYEARYADLHKTLKEEGRYKDGSGLPRRHNILEHIALLESIVDGAGYNLDTYTSATSAIDLASLETMGVRLYVTKEKYKELLGVVERGIQADELARGIHQAVAKVQDQQCVICLYEHVEGGPALYAVHDKSLVCIDCLPLYQEALQADAGDKLDDLKPEQIEEWLARARALYTIRSMNDEVLGDGVIGKEDGNGIQAEPVEQVTGQEHVSGE